MKKDPPITGHEATVVHDDPPHRQSEAPTALAATQAALSPTLDISTDNTVARELEAGPPSVPLRLAPVRYEQRDALGAGGMGEVRAVADRWIGREVARKTLLPEAYNLPRARSRFFREIRVQGQLEHPGIVPVYDVALGAAGDLSFTMRKIQGKTLSAVIEGLAASDAELSARYTMRRLLTAFSSVCMTVHYAHSRGVVHRDLKPSNVMLGDFGEVYVLDWGIAYVGDDPEGGDEHVSADHSTAQNRVAGTYGYMAPEQTRGDAVDARTDVYALGVMLFEVLTLQHVLAGLPTRAALQAVTTTGVDARPSRTPRGAELPPELDAICVRATQRAPGDRFPSAQALSEAVEHFLDGDRDLERRKALAAGYVAEANAAAARALDAKTPAPAADAAREEALRSTMRALALTPDERDAQRTLARLLVEVPAEMPAAAKAEREQLVTTERVHGTRVASAAFLSYLAAIPFVLFAGVRSWLIFYVSAALCLAGGAVSAWLGRRRAVSTRAFYAVLLLSVGITFVQGSWLGPFVLLPTSACLLVTVFTLYARREERFVVRLAGVAMFLVPFLADVAGLVPSGFSFEPGRVVLHERAIGLTPGPTIAALVYTSLTYILLPTLYLARVRDTMRSLEDRHFLQGWYMKRLFPAALTE